MDKIEPTNDVDRKEPVKQPQESSEKKKESIFSFLFRLIFSLALVFLILRFTDTNLNKIAEQVTRMSLPVFFLAYLTVLLGAIPSAIAWMIIVKVQGIKLSLWRLIHLNLVGFFFNSFLPTGVGGDLWRGYALSKVSEKTNKAVASVIVERFTAFGSIVILGIVSYFFNVERFRKAGIIKPVTVFFALITIAFVTGIILTPWFLKKGRKYAAKFVKGLEGPGIDEALIHYRKYPFEIVKALFTTMISPLLECGTYIIILKGMGLDVSILPVFIIVPILRFINHVPVTVSSIGTQDLMILLFWRPLGLSDEQAISLSFISHILRMLVGLTGGLLYVLLPYNKNKDNE